MSRIVESLYGKYGLNESSKLTEARKAKMSKTRAKHLTEDFDDEQHKDIRDKLVKVANNYGFKITRDGSNYLTFEKDYNNYTLEVDIELYKDKLSFNSVVWSPEGDTLKSEYFDDLQTAIAWGESIITPRVQLMQRIEKIINDAGIDDLTSQEFEWLKGSIQEES